MASARQYDITKGEPKEELIAQLHDIGRLRTRHPFTVDIEDQDGFTNTVELFVNGIVLTRGINTWEISGVFAHDKYEQPRSQKFRGTYNTRTRKGSIVFI